VPTEAGQNIKERTFNFALRAVNLVKRLPKTIAGNVLGKQFIRSATSIGANCEEAHAGYTKDDFVFKLNIALREAREAHYWLRLIKASSLVEPRELDSMIDEAEQIKKVLGSIVSKSRKRDKAL
jgi:four helix bundle protein